jgi:hypothetical protein
MLDTQHPPPIVPRFSSEASGIETPVQRVPTPLRHTPKSLRPYVYALMGFRHGREFKTQPSVHRTRKMGEVLEKDGKFAAALAVRTQVTSYTPY